MALKPEISLGVAAATATVVYAVYSQATPNIADVRMGEAGDTNIDAARRAAAWQAAAIVGAISLMSKDPTVFVTGGAMVVLMDWWTRHANAYDQTTGRAGSTNKVGRDEVTVEFADGVGTS